MKKAPPPKKSSSTTPKRGVAQKPAAQRAAATKSKKAAATEPAAPKKYERRPDLGAPIDGFFAKQPPHLRGILDELRKLVDEAAPDGDASIKWGMPFYTVRGNMMCALAGFKSHVNLILAGPPGAFADPKGLLDGDAKGGRHLKLRALDELPRDAVRGWLRTAVTLARKKS